MHKLNYKRIKKTSSKYISHANPVSRNIPKKHRFFKSRCAAAIISIVALFAFTRLKVIKKDNIEYYLSKSTSISDAVSFISDAKSYINKKIVDVGNIGESISEFCFKYLHGKNTDKKDNVYAKESTNKKKTSKEANSKADSNNDLSVSSSTVVSDFAYEFVYPCEGSVTSPFGERIRPTENASNIHSGIDIAAPEGSDVFCSESGTVEKTDKNEYSGNYIVIRHNEQYTTSYAHLSEISVSVGDKVLKKTVIGKVGHTGIATGPHLHFEIRQNGNAVNPIYYLKR